MDVQNLSKLTGEELNEGARFCRNCGQPVNGAEPKYFSSERTSQLKNDLREAAYVLGLIVTIASGLAIIPLCWTLPMTLYLKRKMDAKEKTGIAFDICYFIFVSRISGVLLLVADEIE